MTHEELQALAARLGIPIEQIVRWNQTHGVPFGTKRPRRPKGKQKRPRGTVSVGEIVARLGIPARTIAQWREEGMPHVKIGPMIVVRERVLDKWIERKLWATGDGAE